MIQQDLLQFLQVFQQLNLTRDVQLHLLDGKKAIGRKAGTEARHGRNATDSAVLSVSFRTITSETNSARFSDSLLKCLLQATFAHFRHSRADRCKHVSI